MQQMSYLELITLVLDTDDIVSGGNGKCIANVIVGNDAVNLSHLNYFSEAVRK